MKKLILISPIIGLLIGCSSPGTFHRANTSQENFQKDLWECQQIVSQSYNAPSSQSAASAIGHAIGKAMSETQRVNDCMFGRGYQIQR
jgi:hypothetical protein